MSSSNQNNLQDLRECTVAIINPDNGKVLGTGIIVTGDGLILTCYHVIEDLKTQTIIKNVRIENVHIDFPSKQIKGNANVLEKYCKSELDIAFLQLQKKLPMEIDITNLNERVFPNREFIGFGFRKDKEFNGLHSDGKIMGKINKKLKDGSDSPPFIQIESNNIESGMSGSPILDTTTNKVIGIVSERYKISYYNQDDVDKDLSLGIPVETIIKVYPELKQKNPGLNQILQIGQDNHLLKYLKYIAKIENLEDTQNSSIIEKKSINDYYIQNSAILPQIENWTLRDEEIPNTRNDQDLKQMIYNFLNEEESLYLVIGGTFGIGKTTMVKVIASEFAQNYLDGNKNSFSYIPITVFLKYGLTTRYKDRNLDYVITKIVTRSDYPKSKETNKILLMLDGLDEYNGQNIANDINHYVSQGYNLKVIITSRLEEGILPSQGINVREYVRLLPFTEAQIDIFFTRYGVKVHNKYLNCRYAKELNFPIEVMSKPLFVWMFSFVQLNSDVKSKLEYKTHWTENMKKSWLYLQFFHNIIKGHHKSTYIDGSRKDLYSIEKKELRIVAALHQMYKQIYKKDLTFNELKNNIQSFMTENTRLDFSEITKSYFIYIKNRGDIQLVDFIHKSFIEFLVAEYYIEVLVKDDEGNENKKIHRLNIGIPSKITVEFLDGLIDLLNSDDNDIDEFISKGDTSLLASFNYPDNYPDNIIHARKALIDNSSYSIKNEFIIVYKKDTTIIDEKDKTDNIWIIIRNSSDSGLENLWIYRWISLFIFSKSISKGANEELGAKIYRDKDFKDKLINLITSSGDLIPCYLKNLRNANLCRADLHQANLFRADLSGADLSYANLFRADLSGADLSYANLFRADLSDANISDANLFRADLSQTSFSRANLSDAYFFYANLYDAKFSYANLNYAILSEADLTQTNFSYATLSDANLSYASFSNTDLSYVNLSDSNLSHAYVSGSNKYTNLICINADFDSACICDRKFLRYIRQYKAINVPRTINYRTDDHSKMIFPLKIVKRSPDINAKNVSLYSFIKAEFNQLLDSSATEAPTVKLTKVMDDRCMEGTVSLLSSDYKTIIFLPSYALEPNIMYNVRIYSEMTDNSDSSDISWSFTTMESPILENCPIFGITASGDDGNIALNTIDNNLNTRWSCPGIESWIKLDLGKEKTIYNIQIAWFKGNRRKYNYKIQISRIDEASKFVDICEKRSSGNTLMPEDNSCEMKPTDGRYVKIIVSGNNLNNWASITEIDIYGIDQTLTRT